MRHNPAEAEEAALRSKMHESMATLAARQPLGEEDSDRGSLAGSVAGSLAGSVAGSVGLLETEAGGPSKESSSAWAATEAALQNLWTLLGADRLCCADREKVEARAAASRRGTKPLRPPAAAAGDLDDEDGEYARDADVASDQAPGRRPFPAPRTGTPRLVAADPDADAAGQEDGEAPSTVARPPVDAEPGPLSAEDAELAQPWSSDVRLGADPGSPAVLAAASVREEDSAACGAADEAAAASVPRLSIVGLQFPPRRSSTSAGPTGDEFLLNEADESPDAEQSKARDAEEEWEESARGSFSNSEPEQAQDYMEDEAITLEPERILPGFYDLHGSKRQVEQDDALSEASSDGSLQERLEKCKNNLLHELHHERDLLKRCTTPGQEHARTVAEGLYRGLKGSQGQQQHGADSQTPGGRSVTSLAESRTPAASTRSNWLSESTGRISRSVASLGSIARHALSRGNLAQDDPKTPNSASSTAVVEEVDVQYKEFGTKSIERARKMLQSQGKPLPEPPPESPEERAKRLRREARGSKKTTESQQKMDEYNEFMKSEVANYQELMRERFARIGVAHPELEHFKETLSPAEAVKDAVLKYHARCDDLGKYFPFKEGEGPRGGLPLEDRALLAGYMRDLGEEDPDRYQREPAPAAATPAHAPAQRLSGRGHETKHVHIEIESGQGLVDR